MSDTCHSHHFHDDDHHHDVHHRHQHGLITDPDANTFKIASAGFLQLSYVLVVGGIGLFVAHSAALVSDSAHVMADTIVSFASVVVIRRSVRPANDRASFGYRRLQVRMAEWNGLLFFVLATLLTVETISRLIDPVEVRGSEVVWTGLLSLPVSVLVFWLSHSASQDHSHHHHGKKSAARFAQELHALNDLVGVFLTIVGGAVIWIWGFNQADAVASAFVVISLVRHGITQLKQTGWILLEQAPPEIDIDSLRGRILDTEDVRSIRELHVWSISEELSSMTLQVIARNGCRCHRLERELSHLAKKDFGVSITTIQVIHQEDLEHLMHHP